MCNYEIGHMKELLNKTDVSEDLRELLSHIINYLKREENTHDLLRLAYQAEKNDRP